MKEEEIKSMGDVVRFVQEVVEVGEKRRTEEAVRMAEEHNELFRQRIALLRQHKERMENSKRERGIVHWLWRTTLLGWSGWTKREERHASQS